MSSPRVSSLKIEPVSDLSEVSTLASIFDIATKASDDKFDEVLMRYVDDPYAETVKRLQAALSAPSENESTEQHFVFKAVETVPRHPPGDGQKHEPGNHDGVFREMPTEEKVVGMAYWTIGYIDIPKVDPFQRQATSTPASTIAEESTETAQLEEPIATSGEIATGSDLEPEPKPFDFYAVCRKPVWNTYISQIRGKKHVCKCYSPLVSSKSAAQILFHTRTLLPLFVLSQATDLRRIAVHPDYQRRGIARQLLQWGLERADSERLVSYLNARPQARRLYENGGFKTVDIVPMPVPGLEVSDMIVMVRQPQPVKGL
jgi:GNAT superfamily N-acetyltransferase